MSSSCSEISHPSRLRPPPHAGQVLSCGGSTRVSRGMLAGKGLRAEDCRNGCGNAGSCCSPSVSASSSCRALMCSSASRSWRCVFPQLFGALAELHALQFGNQDFQPVDFAGIRRHPLREQAIVLRHLSKRVLLLQQLRPESGVFIGVGSNHTPTLQQVISSGQAVPSVAGVSS